MPSRPTKLDLAFEIQRVITEKGAESRVFVQSYVEECQELVQRFEALFMAKIRDKSGIFRILHTFKGTSGQIGFQSLAHLFHELESALEPIKDKSHILFVELGPRLVFFGSELSRFFEFLQALDLSQNQISSEEKSRVIKIKNRLELTSSALLQEIARVSASGLKTLTEDMSKSINQVATSHTEASYVLRQKTMDEILSMLEAALIELFRRREDPQIAPLIRTLQQALLTLVTVRTDTATRLGERIAQLIDATSEDLNKKVKLVLEGFNTRLDLRILIALSEALLHLVRNAIDHGIESLAERRSLGKSTEAKLELSLLNTGDRIQFKIADDGQGIDAEKVAAKALAKGLVKDSEIARMNNYEKQELIFLPGFSTRDEITEFSGRGVGMDAVRSAVEGVSGKITIDSDLGRGTTFILTFPASYAFEPMRIFHYQNSSYVFGDRYFFKALGPQEWIFEAGAAIDKSNGELYPLLVLPEIDSLCSQEGERNLLLINFANTTFGLCCDSFEAKAKEIFIAPAATCAISDLPKYVRGGCLDEELGVLQGIDLVELELSINRYLFGSDRESLGGVSDHSALRGEAGLIADSLEGENALSAPLVPSTPAPGPDLYLSKVINLWEEGQALWLKPLSLGLSPKEAELLNGIYLEAKAEMASQKMDAIHYFASELSDLLNGLRRHNQGLSGRFILALEQLLKEFHHALAQAA